MTRKASLPKITGCEDPTPRPTSFTESRMVHTVFVFAIIAALCLGHIHLRFVHTDMKMQHGQLQKQHRLLLQEQDAIERQNEALCDRQRLAVLAQRERMQSTDVRRQLVAVIPNELRKKYSAPIDSHPLPRLESMMASASAAGDIAEKLLVLVESPAHAAIIPEK